MSSCYVEIVEHASSGIMYSFNKEKVVRFFNHYYLLFDRVGFLEMLSSIIKTEKRKGSLGSDLQKSDNIYYIRYRVESSFL